MSREQAHRRFVWLLLAIGLSLRCLWCWHHAADLTDDRDGYIAHAQSVAHGQGFLGPYSQRPTAFRPPAYPIAIGVLQRLGFSPAAAVATLNLGSGLLLLGMSVVLLRRVFFDNDSTNTAVLVGLSFVVCDPLLIRYSSLPMTEVPCAAILLTAITLFVISLDRARDFAGNRKRDFFFASAAGMLFGLGALLRPVVLVASVAVCSVILIHVAASYRRRMLPPTDHDAQSSGESLNARSSSVMLQMKLSLIMLCCCGIAMTPWIIRNFIQFAKFIPATTHGGYTLALGNNPDFYRDVIHGSDEFPWNGDSLDHWQKRMIQQSLADHVPANSETASDAWYYEQAKSAIRNDPSAFVRSCLLRVFRFWAVSPAEDGLPAWIRFGTASWYSVIWLGLCLNVFQLAIRRRRKMPLKRSGIDFQTCIVPFILWAVVGSFLIIHLFYWTDTRMRAPLMPVLAVLASIGCSSINQSKNLTC